MLRNLGSSTNLYIFCIYPCILSDYQCTTYAVIYDKAIDMMESITDATRSCTD